MYLIHILLYILDFRDFTYHKWAVALLCRKIPLNMSTLLCYVQVIYAILYFDSNRRLKRKYVYKNNLNQLQISENKGPYGNETDEDNEQIQSVLFQQILKSKIYDLLFGYTLNMKMNNIIACEVLKICVDFSIGDFALNTDDKCSLFLTTFILVCKSGIFISMRISLLC